MQTDVMQKLVDDLAAELGRAVVVDDPEVRMICASKHYGDEDEQRVRAVLQREVGLRATHHVLAQGVSRWTGPGRIPPATDLGMSARWCVPVRHRAQLLALLLVIDAQDTLTASEKDRIRSVAVELGTHLYGSHLEAADERGMRERAVEDLLSKDDVVRRTGLDNVAGADWATGGDVVVTVLAVGGGYGGPIAAKDALRTVVNDLLDSSSRRPGVTIGRSSAVLVDCSVSAATGDRLRSRAQSLLLALVGMLGPDARCHVGIGGTAPELEGAWCSYQQALVAVDAATASRGGHGSVVMWNELGADALITRLPPTSASPPLLPAPLQRILDSDEPEWLRETLSVFLDNAGSTTRSAATLHIHRTSLYYRLSRIEEITGLDLSNGEDRLLLHIGMRMIGPKRSAAFEVITPGATHR